MNMDMNIIVIAQALINVQCILASWWSFMCFSSFNNNRSTIVFDLVFLSTTWIIYVYQISISYEVDLEIDQTESVDHIIVVRAAFVRATSFSIRKLEHFVRVHEKLEISMSPH